MAFTITKRSGELELFDAQKLRTSLHKAGATAAVIDHIVAELENRPDLRSTADIYTFAYEQLRKNNIAIAGRYSIKQALLQLGPTGFPFEQFIAQLFKAQGYDVETDRTLMGACVSHEIDVIMKKDNQYALVECKFHNELILKCDVKVPLYVKSRFDDIAKAAHKEHLHTIPERNWIVTNTNFSDQAIQYGSCVGIRLISWSYPKHHNLPNLIEQYHLHPITALASLTMQQKSEFISNGFTLCRDAHDKKQVLKQMGLSPEQIDAIVAESQAVCRLE